MDEILDGRRGVEFSARDLANFVGVFRPRALYDRSYRVFDCGGRGGILACDLRVSVCGEVAQHRFVAARHRRNVFKVVETRVIGKAAKF